MMRAEQSSLAAYAPRSLLILGLLLILIATLVTVAQPTNQLTNVGSFDAAKFTGAVLGGGAKLILGAPPPYCPPTSPRGSEDKVGKAQGTPPPDAGQGIPGFRERPCGAEAD
jgi:hypothetical protein